MPDYPFGIMYWGGILLQLLVAVLCGGLIGYQRETLERPAGFRTHVLVCVGSAVYMLVSVAVAGNQYDPGRIAAQVASGIGFLGAGTIIKQGSIVRGLTTAASLWAVAGIGLAAGYGGPALGVAFLGTLVVFIALSSLKHIERHMERGHLCRFFLTITQPRERIEWVQQLFSAQGITLRSVSIANEVEGVGDVTLEGRAGAHEDVEFVAGELVKEESVRGVKWECH